MSSSRMQIHTKAIARKEVSVVSTSYCSLSDDLYTLYNFMVIHYCSCLVEMN